MARAWSWCAAKAAGFGAILLLLASAAGAAVVEKRVRHTVLPDGGVLEETALEVRLDSAEEVENWSSYYLYLDDNRSLERLDAAARRPDGDRVVVKSKRQDRRQISLPGILHGSAAVQEVPFPYLPVGSVLSIEHRVRVAPYFPSGRIYLAEVTPVERLAVEVRGAADSWRWQLEGSAAGLETEQSGGVLTLRASRLPDAETLIGDSETGRAPMLRYAWGPRDSWREVARWYQELLREVPRRLEPVKSRARDLTAGIEDPRGRLEALLAFMRRDVRYVAVEVGIGGYRPSPPDTVLERRWGDCKDKSLLFIDLLEEVGIPSYPALIRSSPADDVDPDFPVPDRFNHLIVAVATDSVTVDGEDPTAEDLLFIDPTQERGTAGWLHPGVQRKHALVVRGDASALVETPDRWHQESQRLTVDLTVSPAGAAAGRAEVLLTGSLAVAVAAELESPRAAAAFSRFLGRRLPRFDLRETGWTREPGDVPALRLTARVQAATFVAGAGARPSLHLPGLPKTPPPHELADEIGTDLTPGSWQTRWRLGLPPGWCRPEAGEVAVANDVGSFRQTISPTDQGLEIERRVDLRARRLAGESMAELKALCLAEHRALKRRLRLHCPESAADRHTSR